MVDYFFHFALNAQTIVRGTVTDAESGDPLIAINAVSNKKSFIQL
ncbi:MAG: hypothetical protein AB8G86_06415 [Saprospiraceae bacterium]